MADGKSEKLSNDLGYEDEEEIFDLDEILPDIGEFGRYQKLLLFGVCLPACIPCGFCAFNQLFMTDVPEDYWCRVPELLNLSVNERKELAIPKHLENGVEVFSRCSRYSVRWKDILINNSVSVDHQNSSWLVEECLDGWEYNRTHVNSSIVIDMSLNRNYSPNEGKILSFWTFIVVGICNPVGILGSTYRWSTDISSHLFDLVCDRDIYPTIGLVALNTGGPVGVYLFGLLNDRAGRKISYFCCLGTLLVGSFITALSTNFWVWAFSRVIVGLSIPAVYQIPFIIALELVGPNYRSFVTVMTCTFYTFGIMMLAVVTYLERDWVKLSYYTSMPFISYFLYLLIMPESPRWLLMKGKLEKALLILETMARVNKKTFPAAFKEKLELQVLLSKSRKKKVVSNVGALDLCRTPNMRLKTILVTLNWFANETVYLGLCYYGPSLGNDQYLSFFLSSLVEIPSYICCWLIMDRFGRRWPMCLLMILGGLSCIITVLLPDDAVTGTLVLFLISKSMLSASFLIIYPFAGELYPTQVRGVGIGTSSYIGGLGLIVIPFITYLGKDNLRLPLVIMGCVSALGGLTGLRLPETLHQKLPQTLEEGELFGKEWSFDDCFKCAPPRKDSIAASYENLDQLADTNADMLMTASFAEAEDLAGNITTECSPLEQRPRRSSMKRLIRQQSVMDTQKTKEGAMQLTYWF